MKNQPYFYFDPEEGSSLCIIYARNKTFVGTAKCAAEDKDMMNEKTGCEIAYHRAVIRNLKDYLEQLKLELKALLKFQHTIDQSKYYNSTDYSNRMLQKQINSKTEEIKDTKKLIEHERQYLIAYLNDKAAFYKKIRKYRQGKNDK